MTSPSQQHSVWVSHPTGNANVRAALNALEQANMLDSLHTCLGVGNDELHSLTGRFLKQRHFPIPATKLVTQPFREALRLLFQKKGWCPSLCAHEVGAFSIDRVYQALDRAVAQRLLETTKLPSAVYCYEDGAAQSFAAAHSRNVTCLYDLPIGYWRSARSIQTDEAQRLPEWADTMPALIDSDAKLARKDVELQQADHIIVASQFTANTLSDAPFDLPNVSIIPYGCPPLITPQDEHQTSESGQPLRVLYVGGLSQRKGLSYLLDAVATLGSAVELTLVGRRVADCKPLDEALETHHWIETLPHSEILKTMSEHDVFVFPSLFEGFGLVLTEALSQGLPIIATSHTCAPDMIEDGKQGFIVPIRDASAIAEKLELLYQDRARLNQMKMAARETAQGRSWSVYQKQLSTEIQKIIG